MTRWEESDSTTTVLQRGRTVKSLSREKGAFPAQTARKNVMTKETYHAKLPTYFTTIVPAWGFEHVPQANNHRNIFPRLDAACSQGAKTSKRTRNDQRPAPPYSSALLLCVQEQPGARRSRFRLGLACREVASRAKLGSESNRVTVDSFLVILRLRQNKGQGERGGTGPRDKGL